LLSDVGNARRADLKESRAHIRETLSEATCYDMMPLSGKLVVLDTRLLVTKAFAALIQHGIRSAVLWDSAAQQYTGMITITDFIQILVKNYTAPSVRMAEMEEYEIRRWRDLAAHPVALLCVDPLASLFEATAMLVTRRIHRLPVIDSVSGNALNILTHKRMLLHIWHTVRVALRKDPPLTCLPRHAD
jgi:5'-AMP-activated protein kinase regulatory gamma subunit